MGNERPAEKTGLTHFFGVVVVHGGPGAAGSADGLARGLEGEFRVVAPRQRAADAAPLTVARHVADLAGAVSDYFPGERPGIVGHSWGAMLALAFAAEHPKALSSLVLVGCGTFDLESRAEFKRLVAERPAGAAYDVDVLEDDADVVFDARGHKETWDDELRLQAEGRHPAAFSAIEVPVLMLHGDFDPHPGRMIRASLAPHVRRLAYRQIARCGHEPWRERGARDEFFRVLKEWLRAQS